MTESDRIRELDSTTVERIAAGEVVERPASVVKELIENSLDADAARIEVTVDGDGTERIRVRDDGVGMSEADVRVAVQQHTTSKIRDVDDLESGVATLGFRGEALHTIGAVSKATVRTKPRDAEREAGTELRLAGGEVESVGPVGCPTGTTVEVRDLFYNTPARRKYLKTEATEFAHVNTVVTRYALANPDVAVSLAHDDREVFATTGRSDLQSTLLSVYGREVATAMREVDAPEGAVGVTGYVSDPETTRSTRDYLSTYVNGRAVTAAAVREAVLDAYGTQLAPDRYPFAVLFLDVPADGVDVNVHPRKMEVRFDDEAAVRRAVREAVEDALLDEGLVRTSAPRGRSSPDETVVAPEREQVDLDGDTGESGTGETATADARPRRDQRTRPDAAPRRRARSPGRRSADTAGGDRDDPHPAPPAADRRSTRPVPEGDRKFTAPTEPAALGTGGEGGDVGDGEDRDRDEFERLPPMRVLGQLHDTYVVAETPDGLVLVDQHAADERVNYERLCERFAGETTTQMLASPVELELTAREAALFDDYREALERVGFQAGRVSERTVAVTTVPAVFADALDPSLLRDVLSEFVTEEGPASVDAAADALLSDLACYPSVTGNTSLTEGSVTKLLAALDDCENPYACPHGRPVLVQLSERELADRFERDYPGHAGRRRE